MANNHHYIPQFYLRNFATKRGNAHYIFVFDSTKNKKYWANIKGIGSERGFNTVDFHGTDPEQLERDLSKLESKFSPHLNEAIQGGSFTSAENYIFIINFIALLYIRNPSIRRNFKTSLDDHNRKISSIAEISGQCFEETESDQTSLIQIKFSIIDTVIRCLLRRKWHFIKAPSESQFITSDNPVVLSRKNPDSDLLPFGLNSHDTVILFPLCPDTILLGLFGELDVSLQADQNDVANYNTWIARFSNNQIYAKNPLFRINLQSGDYSTGEDL